MSIGDNREYRSNHSNRSKSVPVAGILSRFVSQEKPLNALERNDLLESLVDKHHKAYRGQSIDWVAIDLVNERIRATSTRGGLIELMNEYARAIGVC